MSFFGEKTSPECWLGLSLQNYIIGKGQLNFENVHIHNQCGIFRSVSPKASRMPAKAIVPLLPYVAQLQRIILPEFIVEIIV